jgi:hypothetical protein
MAALKKARAASSQVPAAALSQQPSLLDVAASVGAVVPRFLKDLHASVCHCFVLALVARIIPVGLFRCFYCQELTILILPTFGGCQALQSFLPCGLQGRGQFTFRDDQRHAPAAVLRLATVL